MWNKEAQGPNPVPVPYGQATSPGFIKKGDLEGLNIEVSVHLRKNNHLTSKAHLACAPGHHHLQQTQNKLQVQTPNPVVGLYLPCPVRAG